MIALSTRRDATETPLAHAPEVCTGFRERDRVRFIAPGAVGTLFVDDAPLTRDGEEWCWDVSFYAGRVHAAWVDPDGRERGRWLLDVSPDPAKLGLTHFHELVRELAQFDVGLLLGEEPATVGLGRGGVAGGSLVAYARLVQHADALFAALEAARRAPHRSLETVRDQVGLPRLRRIDTRTVLAARGRPEVLGLLSKRGSAPSTPPILDVPDTRWTRDSSANRVIVSGLLRLVQRCETVGGWLDQLRRVEKASETRTAIGPRANGRRATLARLRSAILRVLSDGPWSEVTRAEISAAGLNAVAASPAYARTWRILRTMAGEHVAPEGDDFLWMSPTWEVFERWCFVRLGLALGLDPAACQRYKGCTRRWRGSWNGQPITLWLQPKAPAIDRRPVNGFSSLSKKREPDIVVCLGDRFVVLDAKYSVGRWSVLDQMKSAHIYHDSVRWNARAPVHAGLLVPAPTEVPSLESAAYRDAHGLGVWPTTPTGWDALVAFLAAV